MLTESQISTFRSILQQEKAEIEERFRSNDHFDLNKGHYHESVGELSSYDNHPADEGTELFERGKDVALNEHEQNHLKNVEKALHAIEEGTYGTCEVCGKEIPFARLEALPTTTYCKEHSPDQVTSHERPLEEGVLMPPYGKFNFDDSADEGLTFDSEDSWQEVASWGTSETPQDFVDPPEHYNDTNIESDENIGYVEDYENFVGVDMYGKNVTVYPNRQHNLYEEELDEEGTMTIFGDLPPSEREPYVED
ncbi:TraR/DksA C4-type zinc finger protein [Caldibacillus lycopersici]|uniref:TraR/DksA C4-type zinc finger protein n=1 Tax=Perspicuibacillus lycopersici TaxID=1325689 RepID=A0AAE3LMG8_9BACI|nr:TraR/DksA C4-type zinc finger protein [Perspicuibacillus lycopersici]MCU9613570.1 TraR/DksA C4-type zinc finger protein [Perspicuibacillus lycopersici]